MPLRFALSALFCLFSLAACGRVEPRADLVFIQSAEPETIDPTIVSDQVSMRISSSLFEGLCRFNENGKAQPGMAERWETSEDRKTYVFHLREGVKWSDGRPVTAQDFVYAWRRAASPELASP
jgi:oligopeptide transport system substrate-binding protein